MRMSVVAWDVARGVVELVHLLVVDDRLRDELSGLEVKYCQNTQGVELEDFLLCNNRIRLWEAVETKPPYPCSCLVVKGEDRAFVHGHKDHHLPWHQAIIFTDNCRA